MTKQGNRLKVHRPVAQQTVQIDNNAQARDITMTRTVNNPALPILALVGLLSLSIIAVAVVATSTAVISPQPVRTVVITAATTGREDRFSISGPTLTDIQVTQGDVVEVEASGTITVGSYVGNVEPDGTEIGWLGIPLGDSYDLYTLFPHGALLCRVAGELDWRLCGRAKQFIAPISGVLEFTVNDRDRVNNVGEFNVVVGLNP